MTGGSPRSSGLFYDDVYDRTLYAGADSNCTGIQGVEAFLQEVVDIDAFNGGSLSHLDGGGDFKSQQIPRQKTADGCKPVYPHNFIKTNTIFEVVRQIDGKDSTGTMPAPVPTPFGTNFQTLSVAQKALNAKGGGYADAVFTPNPYVAAAITYIDGAIGKITAELAAKDLTKSTLIVISAKHSQSPADYTRLPKIGHSVSHALSSYLGSGSDKVTGNNLGGGQVTDDDVAFIWLNDQSQRAAALNVLKTSTACPIVNSVTKVVPKSSALMCVDNGHAALLVSHPSLERKTVTDRVRTTQVAPTVIQALGVEPRSGASPEVWRLALPGQRLANGSQNFTRSPQHNSTNAVVNEKHQRDKSEAYKVDEHRPKFHR